MMIQTMTQLQISTDNQPTSTTTTEDENHTQQADPNIE
ncbi:hypothetical protein VRK_00670 [Vibrio sp. MEBiC08052]|nr:hypothetical protein VRK_00670 [Vibrio sp. MEBiC08052]